jgi:methylenetetrahydrofolate dehydrogenase (NADP+)/methenyltetrahydrofolate cyclohydrolase
MGLRLEGKAVVKSLRDNLKNRIAILADKGVVPTALIIRVGAREDDLSYERGILRGCEALAINGRVLELPEDVSQEQLLDEIEVANKNSEIHGIMVFRPLPAHIDPNAVAEAINPDKDIDCMSPINLERVFEGKSKSFVPCTPKAVIEMLKFYDIPLEGANVVIAGRSLVVGKPLAMLMLDENATVTICHSRTHSMNEVTKKADIVVAAIAKAKFMGEDYFTEDSVVIDVGINDDGQGKICGDVDYDNVVDKVKAISPAIGGIGTITSTILLSHIVDACERGVLTANQKL